jgi:hypothetical protein
MWLAGWAARREPASGTSLDLFAKALTLEDATGQRMVIVTLDLIAIPRGLAAALAAEVRGRWKIPRARLLLNASHTHTGPEVRPSKVPFFEIPAEFAARIEPYVSDLQAKIMTVIGSALEDVRPANLSVHHAQVGFPQNRRSADGPMDREVPILQVAGLDGTPRAILFGLACHNLALPPEFCQYHGDYAGVAQLALEAALPGSTALFLAGAGADQDPAPRGTLELTKTHGQELARAVQTALAQPGRAITGASRAALEEIELDFLPLPSIESLENEAKSGDLPQRRKAKFLLAGLTQRREFPRSYPCPVQALRLGDELLLIALGGEPVVDYALQFKSEFAGPLVWTAGYSNDGFGYVPNQRVRREGGYEGTRSVLWSELPMPFAETVEERVVETVRRLVRRVSRE